MLSLVHISTLLHFLRVTSLVTAVLIVIGSLCLYTTNSLPLNTIQQDTTWIIQSITDRRLISTLVAAQASIFCPLFILLNPLSTKSATSPTESSAAVVCFIEWICQLLMPLGLALSWMFSILFDYKTKDLVSDDGMDNSMCLGQQEQDKMGCALFGIIYGLKYVIIVFFSMESVLVTSHFIISRYYTSQIQLPLDDEEEIAVVTVVEEQK